VQFASAHPAATQPTMITTLIIIMLSVFTALSLKSPAKKKRNKRAEDWCRRVLSNQHWEPIQKLMEMKNVKLIVPPEAQDFLRIEPEAYQWTNLANFLNWIETKVPGEYFEPQSKALRRVDSILDCPDVALLGGRRALEIIHRRMRRWVQAVAWDELSGVGKVVMNERIREWTTEAKNFVNWMHESSHRFLDKDENELIELAPIVFVLGAPRTGTTLIQHLLNTDPEMRSPSLFEFVLLTNKSCKVKSDGPFPPTNRTELLKDPRLKQVKENLAAGEWAFGKDFYSRVSASHPTIAMPDNPDEDTIVTWYTGASAMYDYLTCGEQDLWQDLLNERIYLDKLGGKDVDEAAAKLGQEFHEWADVTCLWLKRVYQMLQLGWKPTRWAGKSPYHAPLVPHLIKHFGKDTKFVTPVRDGKEIVPSLSRMVQSLVVGMCLKQNSIVNDLRLLGKWSSRESWGLGHVNLSSQDSHATNVIQVAYHDLMKDPVSTIEQIYNKCGFGNLSGVHRDAIKSYLTENTQGKHGRSKYSMNMFGLADSDVL
jgi:hypothetical protein